MSKQLDQQIPFLPEFIFKRRCSNEALSAADVDITVI